MAFHHATMVANHKGGVLKTQTVANLSCLSAMLFGRTLTVDLDPQGNLGWPLGYRDRSDRGASLRAALMDGTPVEVIKDVRPGLDVIAGGEALKEVIEHAYYLKFDDREDEAPHLLEEALAPIAEDYEWIFLDTSPGEEKLLDMAAAAAKYVLIPTSSDDQSFDGLGDVCRRALSMRESVNPDHEILGLFLGPVKANARRSKRDAKNLLEGLGQGVIPVFNATIRDARATSDAYIRSGITPLEDPKAATDRDSLTSDYRALGIEVFERLRHQVHV